MKMSIGQVFYAIGFVYDTDLYNIHQTVLNPQNEEDLKHYKRTDYFKLTVVQEKPFASNERLLMPNDYTGYLLKDQHGNEWGFNYEIYDGSGRGTIFKRYFGENPDISIFDSFLADNCYEIERLENYFRTIYRYEFKLTQENIKEKFNLLVEYSEITQIPFSLQKGFANVALKNIGE